MNFRDRLRLIRQAMTTKSATDNVTETPPVKAEPPDLASLLLESLKSSGAIPPGWTAEVVNMSGKPPPVPEQHRNALDALGGHSVDYAVWQNEMRHLATPGWSPCRFGARIGETRIGFVYGITRNCFGIYEQPFDVCDDSDDDRPDDGKTGRGLILSTICFLPLGIGLGLFADRASALAAAQVIEHMPWHEAMLDERDQHAFLAHWNGRMEKVRTAWRFAGIDIDATRHAHQQSEQSPFTPPINIWQKTAANLTAGKPERVS